ncbi:MAG: Flp family type IVb pilin [Bacillota bacterium]
MFRFLKSLWNDEDGVKAISVETVMMCAGLALLAFGLFGTPQLYSKIQTAFTNASNTLTDVNTGL